MRTRAFSLLTLVLVAGLALSVHAQSPQVIKVNIPFAFTFGNQNFSAGEYSLVKPLPHVLALRDARGKVVAQQLTGGIDSNTPSALTRLKFHNYDGQAVLTEVWNENNSSGERLYRTGAQEKLAKKRTSQPRERADASGAESVVVAQ
jgi:hypothetical protein